LTYVTVGPKYQITIPKEIRAVIGLMAGDRIFMGMERDRVVLRLLPKVSNPTEVIIGSVTSDRDAVEAVKTFRIIRGIS